MTKKLNLFYAIMTVMGGIMGAGIFMLPVSFADYGIITIYSCIISLLAVMLLSFIFILLSSKFDGGIPDYITNMFGKFVGYQIIIFYIYCSVLSNAAIIVVLSSHISSLLSITTSYSILIEIIVIWSIFIIAVLGGYSLTSKLQSASLILSILPLILVIILSVISFQIHLFIPSWNPHHLSGLYVIKHSIYKIYWTFSGIEVVSILGGLTINPRRNVPLAAILGITFIGNILSINLTNSIW